MFINSSRIIYKIFFTLCSAIFALFLLGSWIAYIFVHNIIATHLEENLSNTVTGIKSIVYTSATLSSRSYLRALAEQYTKITEDLYAQTQTGLLSITEAQKKAKEVIAAKKIGSSGYTYIVDSKGVLQLHPHENLIGKNISDQLFIRLQINRKIGFLEYSWQNPNEKQARQKILYMDYFQPWDWIISVSAYRDELNQLIEADDFAESVLSIKIEKNGYPFIIDHQGNILIHPILSGNLSENSDAVAKLMKNMAGQKQGKISYDWLEPNTGKMQHKIAFFETIDEFDWIVAATANTNDFYAPITVMQRLFVALVCFGLFWAIFVAYHLSKSITSPLHQLLRDVSENSNTPELENSTSIQRNEIEELSEYFSLYIEQLKNNNSILEGLVDEQKQNAAELSIFKEVFDNIVEGISITDQDGLIVQANPAFEKITGYSREEAIGQNPKILKSSRHPESFYENMWAEILKHGFWSGKIWNKRKNGEEYPEWLTISAVRDRDGILTHYAAVFNDITEIVKQQERIQFLAYHDHLTKIPNRSFILEKLKQLLSESKRKNEEVICLICDLDNFKIINDSMGQESGDLLLIQFVERLQRMIRSEDNLGRIGGDEFVLTIKTSIPGSEHALVIINRIFALTETPFEIDNKVIHVTLSIGAAFFPNDATKPEELLKRAILSLNRAEKSTGNSYRFFDPKMEQAVQNKIYYLSRIKEGLQNNEFVPYYQPKVSLTTDQVTGMEALARWESAEGLVSPADFIPISEESGLIAALSDQIYNRAFTESAMLIQQGFNDLKLSVNLSPAQFKDEEFLEKLVKTQQQSGLTTNMIDLEITESILFENVEHVRLLLESLADKGFSISIDDFGTGYSSLQYLKQIPLHTLKIDMSFVSGIGRSKEDEQLVQTISILAKQFGLKIVAEGVERPEQITFLRQLGCDEGQGYYFGKPMKYIDFLEWLSSRKANR